MFFREYCEFIEAIYNVYYSKLSEYDKQLNYRKIKESYDNFGKNNQDFEEIFMR